MRKVRVLLIVVLLVFGVSIGSAAAAPVAATTSLPYVWVRSAPSSNAAVLYTVYPTSYATLETTGNTQWDGYQTWAEVYVTANANIRGWVEQGSLVSASQITVNASNWQVNPVGRSQFGIPVQAGVQGQGIPNQGSNAPSSPQQGMPRTR